jgi:prolipoprotein diacylglyceryl transferase
MTDWRTYFAQGGAGLGAALRIWDGGLGIWGAIALGGVGAWIGCRRRGIPLPAFGDAVAPGIILAQAIGRLGNYFNQELYGRETTMPWGMEVFYRRDPTGFVDVHSLDGVSTGQLAFVVQPTFLYELLWNVLIFVVLICVDRRFTIGHGRLFALYIAGYCVGRFWVELLRDDPATHIAGIRINSFTATFVFIGAVVYFILAPKGREDPATLGGTAGGATDEPEPVDTAATIEPAEGEPDEVAAKVEAPRSEEVTEANSVDNSVDAEAEEPEANVAEVPQAEETEDGLVEADISDANVPEAEEEAEKQSADEAATAIDSEDEEAKESNVEAEGSADQFPPEAGPEIGEQTTEGNIVAAEATVEGEPEEAEPDSKADADVDAVADETATSAGDGATGSPA